LCGGKSGSIFVPPKGVGGREKRRRRGREGTSALAGTITLIEMSEDWIERMARKWGRGGEEERGKRRRTRFTKKEKRGMKWAKSEWQVL
jgi:hypothetical protein